MSGRASAQQWAKALLGRSDWVILDTETTGLDGTAEVVQIGVLAPDGAVLLDTLVKPQGRMSPGARAVNGITDEMLVGAAPYPYFHAPLMQLLQGQTVIAYNAAFDERMLWQTAARYGLRTHGLVWECAMLQYQVFLGRRVRLPNAAHSAISDCQATLEVISRMAALEPGKAGRAAAGLVIRK